MESCNLYRKNRALTCPLMMIVCFLGMCKISNAQVVYTNDFETNANGFNYNSFASLSTTSAGFGSGAQSQFLGIFNNQTVNLSLSGLTVGNTYDIAFDLFIGKSWDGNSTVYGPDSWSLTTGSTTLINTTFNNMFPADGLLNNYTQNFSDGNLIGLGTFSAFTGADVAQTSGFYLDRYAIYKFGSGIGNPTVSFTATSTNETISFAGHGLQDTSDEFWAIDNVSVKNSTYSVTPEAPGFVQFLPGLLPLALVLRKRKKATSAS